MNSDQETRRSAYNCLLQMIEDRDCIGSSHFGDYPAPSLREIPKIAHLFLAVLFPGYYGIRPKSSKFRDRFNSLWDKLRVALARQVQLAKLAEITEIQPPDRHREWSLAQADEVLDCLPGIRKAVEEDVCATYDIDPSTKDRWEVPLTSPGVKTTAIYRVAHCLHSRSRVVARMLSSYAHSKHGIDIHPAAKIGSKFAIDHGTGIVIGETAEIGNNVTIYQGVQVGATEFPRDGRRRLIRNTRRHAIIGDNVKLFANAHVWNTVTVGSNAIIGPDVIVTFDVPAGAQVFCESCLLPTPQSEESLKVVGNESRNESTIGKSKRVTFTPEFFQRLLADQSDADVKAEHFASLIAKAAEDREQMRLELERTIRSYLGTRNPAKRLERQDDVNLINRIVDELGFAFAHPSNPQQECYFWLSVDKSNPQGQIRLLPKGGSASAYLDLGARLSKFDYICVIDARVRENLRSPSWTSRVVHRIDERPKT